MRLWAAILTWMAFSSSAFSQNVWPEHHRAYWSEGNLVRLHRSEPPESPVAEVLNPGGRVLRKIDLPPTPSDLSIRSKIDYLDGVFHVNQRAPLSRDSAGKTSQRLILFRTTSEDRWEVVARHRFEGKAPTAMIPLENGNYLGVDSLSTIFADAGRFFPFAVMKVNDAGSLDIVKRLDADLEYPFFKQSGDPYYGQLMMPFIHCDYTRVDGRIVLGTAYGVFFIFNAKNGDLQRVARLYPGLSDENLTGKSNKALLPGVHAFAARPDGHILISARTQEAVLNGLIAGRPAMGMVSHEELMRKPTNEWGDAINARYPQMEWWDLDPANGKFEREPPPEGFVTRLETEQAFLDQQWRYSPSGVVEKRHQKVAPEPTLESGPRPNPKPKATVNPVPAKATRGQ